MTPDTMANAFTTWASGQGLLARSGKLGAGEVAAVIPQDCGDLVAMVVAA